MAKSITRIVLTGGPAAGKTTLISRILKEFRQEDGWKVITVPESATELISGFGIGPFENCVSMLDFQYFVIADQLHKEQLALKGAQMVPFDKVLVIYDRALFDDKAYISDEEFKDVLASFGKTESQVLSGYDAVIHLVSCAKGAEFAYNYGNAARYETVEEAREMDDRTLRCWSAHPELRVVDNSVNFEDKINRAIGEIYRILGQEVPQQQKCKYLVSTPDSGLLEKLYNAVPLHMVQTYLTQAAPDTERRIRRQENGSEQLYFYTEKRRDGAGNIWVTERPLSEKEYNSYLRQADPELSPVKKTKYRFSWGSNRMELDIYPFSEDKAILFIYGDGASSAPTPPDIQIIRDVSGDAEHKNRRLAARQSL